MRIHEWARWNHRRRLAMARVSDGLFQTAREAPVFMGDGMPHKLSVTVTTRSGRVLLAMDYPLQSRQKNV